MYARACVCVYMCMHACMHQGRRKHFKSGEAMHARDQLYCIVMASLASHENVRVANITAYSEIVPVVIRNGSYYC